MRSASMEGWHVSDIDPELQEIAGKAGVFFSMRETG